MTISLTDPETDRLARAVSALTGESPTEAIRRALAERLDRETVRRRNQRPGLADRLAELSREGASLPDHDSRPADDIAGYDETGMW